MVASFVAVAAAIGLSAVAQDNGVPGMPEDPVAAKAYAVLDQHCSSCHQTGRMAAGKRAGGGIDNLLDLNADLHDRRLVMPGLPEASPLFTSILTRAMPPKGGAEGTGEISAADIDAIRSWLLRGPGERSDCRRLSHGDVRAEMERLTVFLRGMPAERARTTRFFSIGRAGAGCEAVDEIEKVKAGLVFAVNSLSWAPSPVTLQSVVGDGSIVAVDLALLGWSVDQWEALASASPYLQFVGGSDDVRRATGSRWPLLRADWFVATALKAPFYYEVLNLPDSLEALFAALRVTSGAEGARRAGVIASRVSSGRRIIERYPFANGAMWVAADYLSHPGRPDPLKQSDGIAKEFLLDRLASGTARNDGTLVSFDLPNGFRAYFAANASGQRVDDVPTSVLADSAYPHVRVGVAQGCAGCHGAGLNAASTLRDAAADSIRQESSASASSDRDAALKLNSSAVEVAAAANEDTSRYASALTNAGITGGRRQSPVAPVVNRYDEPLIAQDVEREFGVRYRDIAALLPRLSTTSRDTTEMLAFGIVSRRAVETLAGELGALRAGEAAAAVSLPSGAAIYGHPEQVRLRVVAERAKAVAGDTLVLRVRTDKPCHLTLVGVDADNRAMVLFPNDFEQKSELQPDSETVIPSASAPYKFRMKSKGVETIIAICSTSAKPPDGVRHDYEKQRFSLLGDYRAFLKRAWDAVDDEETEARSGRNKQKAAEKRPGRASTGEVSGRTAIQIHVE